MIPQRALVNRLRCSSNTEIMECTESLVRRVPTHSSRAERGAGSREIEECKQGGPVKLLAFLDLV